MISAAVVAYLYVGRARAYCNFMSESMAAGALYERFWVDGDLHGNTLVVHVSWFGEELTECRASGVVNHDVDSAGRRLRIGGRVRRPSRAVVEG